VTFGDTVVAHLDAQLVSAQRLLELVLKQGAAVRERDAHGVLACLSEIQGEMERRGRLERDRTQLLQHAATHANVPAHAVDIDLLATLIEPRHAVAARDRSAQLRGLLAEITREHLVNRALMRQELAFLDHLTRLLGSDELPGYSPVAANATGRPAVVHRVLDLQA
jgi:FlgN protein